MKDFKTFVGNLSVNENLLVPRNLEGRKEKLKQMNIKMLSQEAIDGNLEIDESFMDIDPKFVKLKEVNGDVWLRGNQWTEIPAWLKNIEITGVFSCLHNKLTTLKNCPQKIGGTFNCSNNQLTSLEGCPENIEGNFWCSYNLLTTLKGCPKNIGRDFWCHNNQLTSLDGCPENIGRDFYCTNNNNLVSLEGCPKNIEGNFYCDDNKVKLELPGYVNLKGGFIN